MRETLAGAVRPVNGRHAPVTPTHAHHMHMHVLAVARLNPRASRRIIPCVRSVRGRLGFTLVQLSPSSIPQADGCNAGSSSSSSSACSCSLLPCCISGVTQLNQQADHAL